MQKNAWLFEVLAALSPCFTKMKTQVEYEFARITMLSKLFEGKSLFLRFVCFSKSLQQNARYKRTLPLKK
jgi:hypothetical protein